MRKQTDGRDRQTDRETDRQTGRQTDRQSDRQTDRQTDRERERPIPRQTIHIRYNKLIIFPPNIDITDEDWPQRSVKG